VRAAFDEESVWNESQMAARWSERCWKRHRGLIEASGELWWKVSAYACLSTLADGVNQGPLGASTDHPCHVISRISCAELRCALLHSTALHKARV
jgi:hypothetical protein